MFQQASFANKLDRQFQQEVAKVTGESVKLIRQRGFQLSGSGFDKPLQQLDVAEMWLQRQAQQAGTTVH